MNRFYDMDIKVMASHICEHLNKTAGDHLYCRNCTDDCFPCGLSIGIAKSLIENGYVNINNVIGCVSSAYYDFKNYVSCDDYTPQSKIQETTEERTDSKYMF